MKCKTRAEINKIENRKTIKKTNEIKSWFFDDIKKTDKILANLTKIKKERRLK